MSIIPLIDLPSPNAHKLTAAELSAIFAQFVQVPQFAALLVATDLSVLPKAQPTTPGLPWNNGGFVCVS